MARLLLMAAQWHVPPSHTERVAQDLLRIRQLVRNRGADLKFLVPSTKPGRSIRISALADCVRNHARESVLSAPITSAVDEYFLRWPRDGIQVFGDWAAVANARAMHHVAERLGIATIRMSPLCEGGRLVRLESVALVCNALKHCTAIKFLQRTHQIVYVPSPARASGDTKSVEELRSSKDHIDLDLGIVPRQNNTPLILASRRYIDAFQNATLEAVNSVRAALYVVPPNEASRRVLNLVPIHSGCVLMPSGCPSTQSVLEGHIGRKSVVPITLSPLFSYNRGRGGLACMTSLVI